MEREPMDRAYTKWYSRLLRLYPQEHYSKFSECMEQTFEDLLQENSQNTKSRTAFLFWIFKETASSIIKENISHFIMHQTAKKLINWTGVIALLLMIPFIAMQYTDEVNWTLYDFLVMGGLLSALGLGYELISRKASATVYRIALGVTLVSTFLLIWITLGVGLIGNENNPANLLYFGVIGIGIIGALITRFQPKGMAKTLFTTAIAQLLAPIIALIIWQSQISFQDVEFGVWVLNVFFVGLFVLSAVLFNRASIASQA